MWDDGTAAGCTPGFVPAVGDWPTPVCFRSGKRWKKAHQLLTPPATLRVLFREQDEQDETETTPGLDLFIGSDLRVTNRTGHPALSVPSGFVDGSPTGLHFTGKLFGEPELLLIAHAFQGATGHHLQHPRL